MNVVAVVPPMDWASAMKSTSLPVLVIKAVPLRLFVQLPWRVITPASVLAPLLPLRTRLPNVSPGMVWAPPLKVVVEVAPVTNEPVFVNAPPMSSEPEPVRLIVPVALVTLPVTVSDPPVPMVRIPLVTLRLRTETAPEVRTGSFVTFGMMTVSPTPGAPVGDQFVDVPHVLLVLPVQVFGAIVTVTVGDVPMFVRVPGDPLVWVVKVTAPRAAGARTPEKVKVKVAPFEHVCGMVITKPETVRAPTQAPATAVLPVVGVVQPAGTVTVVVEPAGKVWPTGAVNVKVSVLVEPATTDVGLTVIVPEPSAALGNETTTVGCTRMLARAPAPLLVCVVKVAVPAVAWAVALE